ncbi:MAG: hypothetical protein OXC82_01775 [Rhodobacteraceae bacterium]|nr:hypothetical protein [Paracoccaceae bacterium]MCY4249157.1 hypothetical protein [Paracoccaceae bacterium]MCY4307002.1 hypothetical protein [Paracoccaceae bacterium]
MPILPRAGRRRFEPSAGRGTVPNPPREPSSVFSARWSTRVPFIGTTRSGTPSVPPVKAFACCPGRTMVFA